MTVGKVDLLLGGDLGRWVLDRVGPEEVGRVITLDLRLSRAAESRGFAALVGDANKLVWDQAELGLSVHYPVVLSEKLLHSYQAVYNLHPGYLPWGRGFYPVFWALWEKSPAGATLHRINEGLDQGPLVDQLEVPVRRDDTGGSLHTRVRAAERQLFDKYWPSLVGNQTLPTRAQSGSGSYHARAEFFALRKLTDWSLMNAEDLLRLMRAFSFPGFPGLEIDFGATRMEVGMAPINDQKESKEIENG